MTEAMSTCASCNRKFPTAPPDHIHKCVCGGKMVPDPTPLGMSGGVPAGLDAIRHYIAMRDAKPFRQMDDVIHSVHIGTEWEAELRLSDLRLVATPTPPIEGRDADVERVIAEAISKADAGFGYSFNLTRLIDGEATHTLTMPGFDPVDFDDRDEGYALISERRNAMRAAAIRAALQALGERP